MHTRYTAAARSAHVAPAITPISAGSIPSGLSETVGEFEGDVDGEGEGAGVEGELEGETVGDLVTKSSTIGMLPPMLLGRLPRESVFSYPRDPVNPKPQHLTL